MASKDEASIEVVVRLPRTMVEAAVLAGTSAVGTRVQRRLAAAKMVLASRRERTMCFKGLRFCDPSWDMVLELYVALCEHRSVGVSQLCRVGGGSITTALRHVEHLEARGYIARQPDPDDRRRLLVISLPPLRTAIERWLDLQSVEARLSGCGEIDPQ